MESEDEDFIFVTGENEEAKGESGGRDDWCWLVTDHPTNHNHNEHYTTPPSTPPFDHPPRDLCSAQDEINVAEEAVPPSTVSLSSWSSSCSLLSDPDRAQPLLSPSTNLSFSPPVWVPGDGEDSFEMIGSLLDLYPSVSGSLAIDQEDGTNLPSPSCLPPVASAADNSSPQQETVTDSNTDEVEDWMWSAWCEQYEEEDFEYHHQVCGPYVLDDDNKMDVIVTAPHCGRNSKRDLLGNRPRRRRTRKMWGQEYFWAISRNALDFYHIH